MKNITKKLRGIWFYLCFFASCIRISRELKRIQKLPHSEKQKVNQIQRLYRSWMINFWDEMGIRVEHKGLEKIPLEGCVVVMNHSSFLDIMTLTPFLPIPNKTIAKNGPVGIPIFGPIWESLSVVIDRKDKASKTKGFRAICKLIDEGVYPIIYPEGHRNDTQDKLLPFEDGAFGVSKLKQLPIVPIISTNAGKVLPPDYTFTPGKVTITVLDPVYPLPNEKVEEFKFRVREVMKAGM